MFLIAGLGNPGLEYVSHRHNIGFLVADRLVERAGLDSFKTKFGALLATGELAGTRVVIVKPQEYMNLSGPPIERVSQFFQIPPHQVLAIHDDIDLDFGRLQIKVGGGHGGHNGLRSIMQQIGPAFIRLRLGVGHPGTKERVIGHVLGQFSKAERSELPGLIDQAADAVEAILRDGVQTAMNRYNTKSDSPREKSTN